MKDIDIRNTLLKSLKREYKNDSNTLIIEELGLCQGNARVDIAVINGVIHGYEIKSEKDTLNRLPGQQDVYSKVLDYVTVVTSSRHLSKIEKSVPEWWGLCEVNYKNGRIKIFEIRPHQENPDIDTIALVQLLWRDEALDILKKRNIHKGVLSKPRKIVWNRIVERLSLDDLRTEIREKITARQYWRFGPILK